MTNKTNNLFKQVLFGLCLLALFSAGTGCKGKSDQKKEGEVEKPDVKTKDKVMAFIRYNEASAEGQANLQAYEKAMKIMKTLSCDDPTSWYYQGAIHWTVDPGTVIPNKLCPPYTGGLYAAWQNCTHTTQTSPHFLIWHRLYIWYFEKIVRKYSGKADFALPYWEYVNSTYRVMDPIFRNSNDSLYAQARRISLNGGSPINASFANQYLVGGMQTANDAHDYEVFNSNIENAPHNYMHGYIGGNDPWYNVIYQANTPYGLMSDATSAGFDPIFFVHHSNIDYLWQKWYDSTGQKPDPSVMKNEFWPYVFFDENGKKDSFSVVEAIEKAYNLDYRYDVLPTLESVKLTVPANKKEIFSQVLSEPVKLNQHILNLKVEKNVNETILIEDFNRKATILDIAVSYKTPPKESYIVYINTDKPDPAKIAGYINFFGAEHLMKHMHDGDATRNFLFDISKEYDIKNLKDNLKILIVNSSGKPASEITIRKVRLETRDF
jgi:hypothetical protein